MQGDDDTYAHGHIDLGASSLVACECKQPEGPARRCLTMDAHAELRLIPGVVVFWLEAELLLVLTAGRCMHTRRRAATTSSCLQALH